MRMRIPGWLVLGPGLVVAATGLARAAQPVVLQASDGVKVYGTYSAAAKLRMPVYVTTDPAEEGNLDTVLREAHGANFVRYRPAIGVHGASTLVCSRDAGGCRANLASLVAFLASRVDE